MGVSWFKTKPGGLDLSRSCLDWDSQSRQFQNVGLNSQDNLDSFKKLVLTVEISWSRLWNLDKLLINFSEQKILIEIKKSIETLKDRGSFDRKSLDRNCHFSVDRNFHNQLTEIFDTFQLIKRSNNGILAFKKFWSTAKIRRFFFGSWSKV